MNATRMVHGLRAAGCDVLVAHPDSWLAPLLMSADKEGMRVLMVAREEEGLAVAAGVALGGARVCLAIQNAGFLSLGNGIATLVAPYATPLVMIISNRGMIGDGSVYQAPKGRRTIKVLEAFDLPWHTPDPKADWNIVMAEAFRSAESLGTAFCLVLDHMVTA